MLFVLAFSYMQGVDSTGDYFLVRKNKAGTWDVAGRFNYFRAGSGDQEQSEMQPTGNPQF